MTSQYTMNNLTTHSHTKSQSHYNVMYCRGTFRSLYRIALNFWGPKFLQIVSFEDFIEAILRIHGTMHDAHRTCNVLQVWHTSGLSNIYPHSVYLQGISLKRVPCGFGSLATRSCLSMVLQSECESLCHMSTILDEIFLWTVENSRN